MNDDRAERALREAYTELEVPESVGPDVVRRRVRARRTATLGVAAAVAVVALVGGGLAYSRLPAGPHVAAGPSVKPTLTSPSEALPTDPAPSGWRTEYYRSMSFEVPSSWGYQIEPQSDWCADSPDGQPAERYRTPYVSLGADIPVRLIGCPDMPKSLRTEHVAVFQQPPAVDYANASTHVGDWWVVTRVKGNAVLVVTSLDRALAERIGDSAVDVNNDGPCAAASPVGGAVANHPSPPGDVGQISSVTAVVLCQYEPDLRQSDRREPRGLRAVRTLTGSDAQRLVDLLAAAPRNPSTCQLMPQAPEPDIAVSVQIHAADGMHEIFVHAAGCPDGIGSVGGIDDGTTVRVLTRDTCRAILVKPVEIWSASAEIGTNCLG